MKLPHERDYPRPNLLGGLKALSISTPNQSIDIGHLSEHTCAASEPALDVRISLCPDSAVCGTFPEKQIMLSEIFKHIAREESVWVDSAVDEIANALEAYQRGENLDQASVKLLAAGEYAEVAEVSHLQSPSLEYVITFLTTKAEDFLKQRYDKIARLRGLSGF